MYDKRDSLASLSHLDSVLWPMPRLAAAWARDSSECSLTYWTALFLNSLSNVFLFLDLDILIPFFHLLIYSWWCCTCYVSSLYSSCPLFMLAPLETWQISKPYFLKLSVLIYTICFIWIHANISFICISYLEFPIFPLPRYFAHLIFSNATVSFILNRLRHF